MSDPANPTNEALLAHLRESFETSARVKRETVVACGDAIADAAASVAG